MSIGDSVVFFFFWLSLRVVSVLARRDVAGSLVDISPLMVNIILGSDHLWLGYMQPPSMVVGDMLRLNLFVMDGPSQFIQASLSF